MRPVVILAALLTAAAASAQPSEDARAVAEGRIIVQRNCVGCHRAEPEGYSILSAAPPFRTMKTIDGPTLQERVLHAGRGDPRSMPQIILTLHEADAVAAYIRALANADSEDQKKLSLHTCLPGMPC